MMDKSRKLRRYKQKDYTHLVDFPVEIVGRDGVVRRYSYEDSIRLYQRRISSAQARYVDGDVVDAEVIHCRHRIGQLRRSYFARYDWNALRVSDRPGLLAGEFAGEVADFLRRVRADSGEPMLTAKPVQFALLEDREHHQLYGIRHGHREDEPIWLLALYRFAPSGTCAAREAFFGALKVVQSVSATPGRVEQLIGFHHTGTCGLVLTSTEAPQSSGGLDVKDESSAVQWLDFAAVEGDPLQAAFAALRRGKLSEALVQFSAAYEAQPFRRAAYVGAGVVADQLGAFDAAHTAALMGVRYLPDDDFLQYQLALVRLRLGQLALARETIAQLAHRRPDAPAPLLLSGLLHLASDRWIRGVRDIQRARVCLRGTDPDLSHAAQHVMTVSFWAASALLVGLVLSVVPTVLSVLGWAISSWVTHLLLLLTVGSTSALLLMVRARLRRLLRAPSGWGLRINNPHCLRSDTGGRSRPSTT